MEDLFLNAKRKASRGLYDDAAGRVYRALEVLVDARLRIGYDINKNDLDLDKLEKILVSQYKQGDKLSLKESLELLLEINIDDELAVEYVKRRERIDDSLSIRNSSLFAHGYTPISEKELEGFLSIVEGLYKSFLERLFQNPLVSVQFPQFSDIFL